MKSFLILLMSLFSVAPIKASLPEDAQLVGIYEISKKIKIVKGSVIELEVSPIQVSIFTDGVMIYYEYQEGQYSSFVVYDDKGIGELDSEQRALLMRAGLQGARETSSGYRHIRLTSSDFSMTHFPTLSNQIITIYGSAQPK